MAYHIGESFDGRTRSQDGATREYRITWFDSGPGGETPGPTDMDEAEYFSLSDSTPDTAWNALSGWMSDTTKSPAEPLTADVADRRLLVNSLYGFRSTNLKVVEVPGSDGREFTGFATWGSPNVGGASSRSRSSSNSENEEIADDPNAEVKKTTTISASRAASTADYIQPIFIFSRQIDPLGTGALQGLKPEFAPGIVNSVQSESGGPPQAKGLDYSPPPANFNIRYEITGAPPKSTWVEKITDAANDCSLNSDVFRLGGIVYQPREIAFVSANVSTDSAETTTVDLGFAVGRRTALNITQVSGIWKILGIPFVHDQPDYWLWNVNAHSSLQHYSENPGKLTTYTNAQAANPPTDTVAMAVDINEPIELGEYFYQGPHDYVWQYMTSTTDENTKVVTSEIDNVSTHAVWPLTQYKVLFGAIGL